MKFRLLPGLAFTVALCLTASPLLAEGWGGVKGQVILDDDIPELEPVVKKGANVKDPAICAAQDIANKSLVVDEDSGGVSHVFIYVKEVGTVHPDLAKVPTDEVVLDQKGCEFFPHSLLLRAGQPLRVLNDDACLHNTHSWNIKNDQVNITLRPNDRKGEVVTFEKSEILPIKIGCDIHSYMSMRCLILDHPYMVVTDKEGNFELKNLPEGTHEIRVWHETAGYLLKEEVEVKADATHDFGEMLYEIGDFKLGK